MWEQTADVLLLLSWEDSFYSLIELSQFHLLNEGGGGGAVCPFRGIKLTHIETWGGGGV